MTRLLVTVAGAALLLAAPAPAQQAAKLPRPAQPIPGAHNDLDVPYLPERLTGRPEDRWVKLNVHWPKDDQKHPCIIFVHGGGYGSGDKEDTDRKLLEHAVQEGFVAVNLNYILGDDGIFPQVYWDFRAAVRFLRKHADKYHIDPARVGAWGFSAGGWLTSSACFTAPDDLWTGQKMLRVLPGLRPPPPDAWRRLREAMRQDGILLVGMDDPQPRYGEYSARLQAIDVDFYHHQEWIDPAAPAILSYVGEGGVNPLEQFCKPAGVDFVAVAVEGAENQGKTGLHCPPLHLKTTGEDGVTDVEVRDRVLQFFKRQLVTAPRCPVPEFRPNRRLFADRQMIEIIVPAADAIIHFTTDGTEPTPESPVYQEPFAITESTTIKALALRKGERTSGIATAVFTKGMPPPFITGPEKLPQGKTGVPYTVAFTTKRGVPAVVWSMTGHLTSPRMAGQPKGAHGLLLDSAKGVLAGTPTKPGCYTILMQAGWEFGQLAGTRTYVLEVE